MLDISVAAHPKDTGIASQGPGFLVRTCAVGIDCMKSLRTCGPFTLQLHKCGWIRPSKKRMMADGVANHLFLLMPVTSPQPLLPPRTRW